MDIYYFSGTGNCLALAKQIAAGMDGCRIVSIAQEMRKSKIIIDADSVMIIFPVYAYDPPGLVMRFLKCAEFHCRYVTAVATYASRFGAALLRVKKILGRKGVRLNYSAAVKTVENYIPIFGIPKDTYVEKRLKLQSEQAEEIISYIKEEKYNSPKKKFFSGRFISLIFRSFKWIFPLFYRASKYCNGCGKCEKLCPVGAITLKKKRPKFSLKCSQCQACLNWCPHKAIRFLRYKHKSGRYTHPDVSINEINK